jgi:hypothetical protein
MALTPVRKQDSWFETDSALFCSCQTADFVLALAYAQTTHPHLFPAADGLGAVVLALPYGDC